MYSGVQSFPPEEYAIIFTISLLGFLVGGGSPPGLPILGDALT